MNGIEALTRLRLTRVTVRLAVRHCASEEARRVYARLGFGSGNVLLLDDLQGRAAMPEGRAASLSGSAATASPKMKAEAGVTVTMAKDDAEADAQITDQRSRG